MNAIAVLASCLLVTASAAFVKPSNARLNHLAVQSNMDSPTDFLQKGDRLADSFLSEKSLAGRFDDGLSQTLIKTNPIGLKGNPSVESNKFSIVIGTVSGTLIGSFVGIFAGFNADMPGAGGVIGSISGGVTGGLMGWYWYSNDAKDTDRNTDRGGASAKAEPEEAPKPTPTPKPKPTIATKEFAVPALEKLRQQAAVAVALSDYEQDRAKKKGDTAESDKEKAMEKKASKVLAALSDAVDNRTETGKKEPMNETESEFQDIQEVLSQGDTSDMVTAESAMANNAVVTANDLARVSGDGTGKQIRGEDLGSAGDLQQFEGDMIPEDTKQMMLFQTLGDVPLLANQTPGIAAGDAWPNGVVKYCFASDIAESIKHIFTAATHQYKKAVPCLTFENVGWVSGSSTDTAAKQKCKESPAIFVQSNPEQGCYSYVGVVGTHQVHSQALQLQDPGCMSIGTAIHELGHAIGMAHEQSRPDRTKYVKINWNNIKKGTENNFEIDKHAYTQEAYDMTSIMHYDRFAFAVDTKKPTIEYIGAGVHDELGQRVGLSKYDVSQVVAMYTGVNTKCKANALAGMGCVNKTDNKGNDICASATKCDSRDIAMNCCACGGGIAVQCYEGGDCPQVKKLPPPAADQCIQDVTHLFPDSGMPCVYTNMCKYDVGFKCSGGCENVAHSKLYEATQCNSEDVTDICKAKSKCTVHKV